MRAPAILLAALLLAGASAEAAYTCDSTTCVAPNCMCASTAAPGGLSPQDTPMLVLISHDDSVNELSNRLVRSVTDGYKNPNGCNVPATWFTMQSKTNCTLVQQLVKDNHEIAGHTLNHMRLSPNLTVAEMEAEVGGIKKWLVDTCGVPAAKLKGFRAPYLVHNEQLRNILTADGYTYDSSLIEPSNSLSSPSFAQRTFPYTMDAGIPQDCNWSGTGEGTCTASEKHAGLWEVPLYILADLEGNQVNTMDPVAANAEELFQLLKKNFDAAYSGNRAPFPLFVHAPWFTFENIAGSKKFVDYVIAKPDVWFVTITQLLEWMQNPVPASQIAAQLTCNPVELTPPPVEYCRKYKAGAIEDIWTLGAKWGVAVDEDILSINPKLPKWSIPEGYVVNLPPWDARCEKAGAAFFPDNDWYNPVYTERELVPVVAAPAPAPVEAAPAAPVTQEPTSTTTTPAEAAGTPVPVPAQEPAAAAPTEASKAPATAVAPAPVPVTAVGNAAGAAAAPVGSAVALLLAGLAALCLVF